MEQQDPLWYKDAIIYELHVKAFFDGNGDGVGDFPGLIAKLDYVQELGVNTLWLLPFSRSPMRDDGYDISDYRGIYPAFGTKEDFRKFIDEAHRRDLRVITELVVNHTPDQHPWFQAARRAPPGSTKRDYYVWSDIAEEDRHPIVEIMEQTPDIADNCQWAIFLRNHDELTLEMVTDRERDYPYQTYASDPQARLNLGIRRRLAPLLDNDRHRIEPMHLLLMTLPGLPILYYGDEIGMGDNIRLGDRNGVRTPMQWSGGANGGFSTADPQHLYLPPIDDPVYGFGAVNVESQHRNPSSLLNWMNRMVAMRKGQRAFGRGTLRFLRPGNRKILAYLREHAGETILCVANLSRAPQPVELDLSPFRGRVLVELTGRSKFPPIGELPYLLTLSGHGFYAFRLATDVEASSWHEERPVSPDLPVLVLVETGWRTLFGCGENGEVVNQLMARRARDQLEGQIIPRFLRSQAWFVHQGAQVDKFEVGDMREWTVDTGNWLLATVAVTLSNGEVHQYATPLALAWEDADDAQARALLHATLAKVSRLVLKGFRWLLAGVHPELEVSRFLTETAKFTHMPQLAGAVEYSGDGGPSSTFAILERYAENQGSAWAYTLDYLERFLDACRASPEHPPDARHIAYMGLMKTLGLRTAEFHRALALPDEAGAFGSEPVSAENLADWVDQARHAMDSMFELLELKLPRLPDAAQVVGNQLLGVRPRLYRRIRRAASLPLQGMKTRYHGDYHLAQVWLASNDFLITNFGGEPGRCLAQGFAYQGEASSYREHAARGEASAHLPPQAFASFLQCHDHVSNRAFGERIGRIAPEAAVRAAAAVYVLAPSIPMLFMGEEFAAASPFLFFCDFGDELRDAVTQGRRREFARFADPAMPAAITDPNRIETFSASKLDWDGLADTAHVGWLDYYRELLKLRREVIVPRLSGMGGQAAQFELLVSGGLRVQWRLGDGSILRLAANLSGADAGVVAPCGRTLFASSALAAQGLLAPWSVVWTLEEAKP